MAAGECVCMCVSSHTLHYASRVAWWFVACSVNVAPTCCKRGNLLCWLPLLLANCPYWDRDKKPITKTEMPIGLGVPYQQHRIGCAGKRGYSNGQCDMIFNSTHIIGKRKYAHAHTQTHPSTAAGIGARAICEGHATLAVFVYRTH